MKLYLGNITDEELKSMTVEQIKALQRKNYYMEMQENIWPCRKCGKHDKVRNMIRVSGEFVPRSISGWYCPKHARIVVEKYKRFCSVCGSRFRETHDGGKHKLCPDCRQGDLGYEQRRINYNLRRAIEASTPATLTLSEWLETLDYFDWKCAYCGGEYYLMEHFIPISEGGGTTKDNCVPACSACNCQKAPNSCMPERKLAPVADYLRSCVL